MLEKIEAKQHFIREGFSDLFRRILEDDTNKKNILPRFDQLIQLSSITLGADSLYKKNNEYLPCKQMWEYTGVYYGKEFLDNIISSNAFGMSVVTDDDDSKAMLHFTPESNILVRNIIDYIHTFPACVDGLKIAFIAPSDMQHIVAAMHTVAKEFKNTRATIYLELICMNSKKNSTTYLKKWLDSFFEDENKVKIITYLKYLSVGNSTEISRLKDYISNFDICFNTYLIPVESSTANMTAQKCVKWLNDTQTVPAYLDAACISRYHRAYEKVEQTLHSCRIQGVLSMYRELTSSEQEEFIRLISK